MLDKSKGVSKIALLMILILQVIEILVQLDFLPPRGSLMKLVYAGIATCWLLAGKSVYNVVLPVHNLPGKIIKQSTETIAGSENDYDLPVIYSIRQAPAKRLRDFLISIGKHNYAIMEQSGQTYLVFYNNGDKNSNTGLKEMLLKLFPGLVLEQTGFDQLLGLPGLSQANSMNQSTELLNDQKVSIAGESSDEFFSGIQLSSNVVHSIMEYMHDLSSEESSTRIVTGAFIGNEEEISSYILFNSISTHDEVLIECKKLQKGFRRQGVVLDNGQRATIPAFFAGVVNDTDNQSLSELTRFIDCYNAEKDKKMDLPLVVLLSDKKIIEAFSRGKGNALNVPRETLFENISRVPVRIME
ncbi:MAG: hypothetical protein ACTSRU_15260 [Candidatus Hodarchaeales archaeon]